MLYRVFPIEIKIHQGLHSLVHENLEKWMGELTVFVPFLLDLKISSKVTNSSSFFPTISSHNINSYYIGVPLSNVPVNLLAGWVVLTTPLSDLIVK